MEQLHIQKPYISCPKLRISDILPFDEEEDEDEDEEDLNGGAAFDMSCLRWKQHEEEEVELERRLECPSPRKTISRWMKSMVEKKKKVGKWRGTVERECAVVDLDRRMGATCDGRDSSSTIASGLDESGSRRRESMLNLGVACSLLYIIAASKNELNRMKELRTEMDITLQKMRAIMQRKDSLDELSESKDGASSCLTDVKEALSCSSRNSRQSDSKLCHSSKQETLTACESVKHDKSKQESIEGLEELEAELEAELEHLQLQLDGEGFSKYSQHHNAKTMVEDAALSGSSASAGEVTDPREVPAEFQHGVPPVELERKLHELLESRQQERIEELEAALRLAERKLREKEKEISWWKDTALIISQHAVEPSRCVMQQNTESINC